jgi:hypothetical protein
VLFSPTWNVREQVIEQNVRLLRFTNSVRRLNEAPQFAHMQSTTFAFFALNARSHLLEQNFIAPRTVALIGLSNVRWHSLQLELFLRLRRMPAHFRPQVGTRRFCFGPPHTLHGGRWPRFHA